MYRGKGSLQKVSFPKHERSLKKGLTDLFLELAVYVELR